MRTIVKYAAACFSMVCAGLASSTVAAGVLFGAAVDPDGSGNTPAAVAALESQLGRKLAIDHFFTTFDLSDMSRAKWDVDNGRIPMISLGVGFSSGGCASATDIAAGKYDAAAQHLAEMLKGLHGRVLLRFRWEMTANRPVLSCFYDGIRDSRQAGPEYVAAWNHLRGIFQNVGATNVEWVWAPGGKAYVKRQVWWTYYFPGAANVDWIGLDCYNQTTDPMAISEKPQFLAFYNAMSGMGRPLILAETGAIGDAAQSAWLTSFRAFKTQFPAVRAVVWWDSYNPKTAFDYHLTPGGRAALLNLESDPFFAVRN